MKERSRLTASITLTVLVHAGFISHVGQLAATVPANKASSVMQFNLVSMPAQKPFVQQPQKDKLSAKQTAVLKKTPPKKTFKEAPVEKTTLDKRAALKPTETVIAKKRNSETKTDPVLVETSTKQAANSQTQANKRKSLSVVRQVDNIIVQEARFKSLPPPPTYPRRARLRGQQGMALIHARLDAGGEVIETRLAKSSGFSLLDKAAMKAVCHWDFMPESTEQGNVQVWVEIPVEFILNQRKVS
jgi:protein TonB